MVNETENYEFDVKLVTTAPVMKLRELMDKVYPDRTHTRIVVAEKTYWRLHRAAENYLKKHKIDIENKKLVLMYKDKPLINYGTL